MVKKHLLFLGFQLKSTLRIIPRLVLCMIIFGVITCAAGYCGNKILNDNASSPVQIKVAAVMPDDDSRIALGFKVVQSMDSLSSFCTFVPADMDSALAMMDRGEVVAVAVIPEGFVNGIMYGDNIPATVIMPENAGLETLIFCNVIDAGGHSLAYVQSGIYAVDDLLWAYNQDAAIADAENYLNDYYTRYALNRAGFFKSQVISATGNISALGYYLCSGIILIILLCAITAGDCFASYKPVVMESLKINRISKGYIRLSEFAAVTTVFAMLFGGLILAAGLSFASSYINLSLTGALAYLLLVASLVSFIMCLCTMADSGLVSTLLIFLLTAGMLYVCGRIVPDSYLPDAAARIGRLLPVKHWCELLESILFGRIRFSQISAVLGYTLGFVGLSIGITVIKGRER